MSPGMTAAVRRLLEWKPRDINETTLLSNDSQDKMCAAIERLRATKPAEGEQVQ
jgi:hypothetical protein